MKEAYGAAANVQVGFMQRHIHNNMYKTWIKSASILAPFVFFVCVNDKLVTVFVFCFARLVGQRGTL